jgi:hypothetical protein
LSSRRGRDEVRRARHGGEGNQSQPTRHSGGLDAKLVDSIIRANFTPGAPPAPILRFDAKAPHLRVALMGAPAAEYNEIGTRMVEGISHFPRTRQEKSNSCGSLPALVTLQETLLIAHPQAL